MTSRKEHFQPANRQDAQPDSHARRTFLKTAAALPFGLAANHPAERIALEEETLDPATMPTIAFGEKRVSRLIVGGNPVNGGSHLSRFVDFSMREYFTDQRIAEFLTRCQNAGINTWQSSRDDCDHWLKHRNSGGSLNYISLGHEDLDRSISIEAAIEKGVMGLAHHGEVTDRLFKSGELDSIQDYLKKVRDAGLLVGVSTHMPAVIQHIEDRNWDVDFYMTCVYERHRSREQLKKLLGYIPLREREVYLEEDPPRMYRMIQATSKTCLAFKILAAGRLCQSPKTVANAFETTFKHIKATDAVIVGIFPRWTDQITEDARLARQFGSS